MKRKAETADITRGELVLWAVFLLLGCCLLVSGVFPARAAERQKALELQRLHRTTQELIRARDRLNLRRQGLENDRDFVERHVRDEGYTPKGAVRVVEERHR